MTQSHKKNRRENPAERFMVSSTFPTNINPPNQTKKKLEYRALDVQWYQILVLEYLKFYIKSNKLKNHSISVR